MLTSRGQLGAAPLVIAEITQTLKITVKEKCTYLSIVLFQLVITVDYAFGKFASPED